MRKTFKVYHLKFYNLMKPLISTVNAKLVLKDSSCKTYKCLCVV